MTALDQRLGVIPGVVTGCPVDAHEIVVLAVEGHRGDGRADFQDAGLPGDGHDHLGHAAGERANHGFHPGGDQFVGRSGGSFPVLGIVTGNQLDHPPVQAAGPVELLDGQDYPVLA